jgi:hypothetical protein
LDEWRALLQGPPFHAAHGAVLDLAGDTQRITNIEDGTHPRRYDHKQPLTTVKTITSAGRRTRCSPVNTGLD